MDAISKVKVNNETYELKDLFSRERLKKLVDIETPQFEGSPSSKNADAKGLESIAIGDHAAAIGDYTSAFGTYVTAAGTASHAEGEHVDATGNAAHAEGIGKFTENNGVVTWDNSIASGEAAHSEGKYTKAVGDHSHAEGCETNALGHASHAEGCTSTAAASYSHVEGQNNLIKTNSERTEVEAETGVSSHVEGANNTNGASYAHIEGHDNIATASAQGVHISGHHNEAFYPNNILITGKYNKNKSENILEIGNGYLDETNNEAEIRKNVVEITEDGKMYIDLDDVIFLSHKDGVDNFFSLTDAVLVDNELNGSSVHPVQNRVIEEKLREVFQCVSEGKNNIKQALTDLGVDPVLVDKAETFDDLVNLMKTINPQYLANSNYIYVRDSSYTIVIDQETGMTTPAPLPVSKTVPLNGSFVDFFTVQVL